MAGEKHPPDQFDMIAGGMTTRMDPPDDDELRELLLGAPDGALDACMHPLIRAWDHPPTALQVLEVVDHCVHSALASGLILRVLQAFYDERVAAEGTTHDAVAALATWRHR